jgi:hypothetical protein
MEIVYGSEVLNERSREVTSTVRYRQYYWEREFTSKYGPEQGIQAFQERRKWSSRVYHFLHSSTKKNGGVIHKKKADGDS